MEHQPTTELTDEQLETILNESEDEDSDTAEPFPEDLDHLFSTTSESEAKPEATPQPVQIATSLRRVRTRGGQRTRGGRGQRFPVTPEKQEPSYPSNNVNSEDLMKYLNEYIDDNLIDTIVQKTNQTSIEKTGKSIHLTREECFIYIWITLLMACLPLSQIRIYWNQKYALPVITQAMTRDRYFLLRNSMKVVFDNDNYGYEETGQALESSLLSTIHAAENFDDCRRYDRSTRQYLFVSRPEVIKEYNSNMGGVDLTDRLIAVCPSKARTRKWTVRFISHCLDLSITNSWIKFKQEQMEKGIRRYKIVQLREFKRLIAERLIEENLYREDDLLDDSGEPEERRNVKKRRPPKVPLPSKLRRKHGTDHLPEMLTTQESL